MWRTGRGTRSTATTPRLASRSSGSGLLSRYPQFRRAKYVSPPPPPPPPSPSPPPPPPPPGNGQRDTVETAPVCLRHLQVNTQASSPVCVFVFCVLQFVCLCVFSSLCYRYFPKFPNPYHIDIDIF